MAGWKSSLKEKDKITWEGQLHANSFIGDGSGLTNVTAPASDDWTVTATQIYPKVASLALVASSALISGNVGIGTTSPSELFEVNGTGKIAGLTISNDGTKTTLLGTDGDYNRIGDGAVASQDLQRNDDLLVTGRLEVDGIAYFEGPFEIYANDAGSTDAFTIKNTGGAVFYRYVPRIHDGMHIAIGSAGTSYYNFIYTTYDNRGKNHDHTQQVNPTIVIHSATNPDTNNTQWLSLTHDQTDGVIGVGTGALKMPATLKVGSTTLTEQNVIDLLALLA